jgi:biotin-[acetyl-CoA-carboxylase] ligase BirA-like protein
MIVHTDSPAFAHRVLGSEPRWSGDEHGSETSDFEREVALGLLGDGPRLSARIESSSMWRRLLLVEYAETSQWDVLVQVCGRDQVPVDGLLCLAGSGRRFRGQRDRSWLGLPGNLQMVVCLAPGLAVERFGMAFSLLSAVAVVDCIDTLPGLAGKAGIKWVNDILIQGKKVAGFLAQTWTQGELVRSALLGIGLNVETSPGVLPDAFVAGATCLREHAAEPGRCTLATAFSALTESLERRYRQLLAGHTAELLAAYRERSLAVGRRVAIWSDPSAGESRLLREGRLAAIGDNLELFLEGSEVPVTAGRLVLVD